MAAAALAVPASPEPSSATVGPVMRRSATGAAGVGGWDSAGFGRAPQSSPTNGTEVEDCSEDEEEATQKRRGWRRARRMLDVPVLAIAAGAMIWLICFLIVDDPFGSAAAAVGGRAAADGADVHAVGVPQTAAAAAGLKVATASGVAVETPATGAEVGAGNANGVVPTVGDGDKVAMGDAGTRSASIPTAARVGAASGASSLASPADGERTTEAALVGSGDGAVGSGGPVAVGLASVGGGAGERATGAPASPTGKHPWGRNPKRPRRRTSAGSSPRAGPGCSGLQVLEAPRA